MQRQRSFKESLEIGRQGERIVERWLQKQGCGTIPTYDYTDGNRKAPALAFIDRSIVIPDIDVVAHGERFWAEVKNYGYSPWNQKYKTNVHGFTSRLWECYLEVERLSGNDVWLFVVERAMQASDESLIPTGVVLAGRLAGLPWWSCQCHECQCEPKSRHLRYFRRDAMMHAFNP